MNRDERSQIRQMVLTCRRLLQDEFDQLLRLHGLLPDRQVSAPLDRQEARMKLDEALGREAPDYATARQRYVKHAAFTFLNRLLALRLAEAHGLIPETVLPRPEYGERSRRERDLSDSDPSVAANPEKLAQSALKQAFDDMRTHIPCFSAKMTRIPCSCLG